MPLEPKPPVTDPAGPPSWMAPVKPVVPDHELLRRIGGGSYGDVWLARTTVGTWRAVKVVFRDRFTDARPYEREFNGMQKFEPLSRGNEAFVDILQIGRNDAEGYFYYVMELADDAAEPQVESSELSVEGEAKSPQKLSTFNFQPSTYVPKTLSKVLLQRGRLPLGECLELGVTLNLGLAHLHRAGLIHRDIKPSNLIFVGGVPKLADIGLVIETAEARSYVGTEGFIPPEGPNSPQADLYSLGKVLYEAGMGKDRKDFPEPFTQLIDAPNSTQLLEFNAILLKACAANVKERYQSAEEMNADLALLQSGGSVRRQRKLAGQLRFVQRAGAVVTVIAALAAGLYLWQARQTGIVRNLADQNRQIAEEKTKLATEKTSLAEANREQLVRLRIANGVRLMDLGDFSGALLWFAEALPLVTNNPVEESIHRIRIQQVLKQSPSLVQVMNHGEGVDSSAFSPDGRRLATSSRRQLRVWDTDSGQLLVGPVEFKHAVGGVSFSADGKRLLLGSSFGDTRPMQRLQPGNAVAVDAMTGLELWPAITNVQWSAFSPDERWLAVAHCGTNFVVELFDALDGRSVRELRGHTNEITMLTFARGGNLLASGSQDTSVRLWAIPSGEPVGQTIFHDKPVQQAVFSPDAQQLATAEGAGFLEKRGLVHTWQTRTGVEISSPVSVLNGAFGLAFDYVTGRRLLVGGGENWVSVLDAETHLPVCPNLALESGSISCWAFSSDGLRVATGSIDGTVRVWDLETGMALTPRLRHIDEVRSVRFSPDGSRLVSASDDGTAKIWNLAAMVEAMGQVEVVGGFWPLPPQGYPFALSQDGKRLLLSSGTANIQLIELEKLSRQRPPLSTSESNLSGTITFDASGHQWASAVGSLRGEVGPNGMVDLWRKEGGELRHSNLQHSNRVDFIQFSGDGTRLWTWGSEDRRLRSWQTADAKLLEDREISETNHWKITMSANGERAVMFMNDGFPELLDLRNQPITRKKMAAYPSTDTAFFSPDGMRVAAIFGQEGWICDTASGKPTTPLFKHGGRLTWIEWRPDGREVLTAGVAGDVKLWDAATGQPTHRPMDFGRSPVLVAHYSPDGRFVVARNNEKSARVWDAKTAEPITPILHHPGDVQLAVIAKDNRLVTVSDATGASDATRLSFLGKNLSAISSLRVWGLTETKLSVSLITDYAHLASGRKLDRAGVPQPIGSAELSDLFQAMRTNHPALFRVTDEARQHWHRQQIPEPRNLTLLRAGEFHLERLANLAPADPWFKQQQTRSESLRSPPRDASAPPNLLDLSLAYTHSFEMLPFQEFKALPRGIQEFAGTRFDVRGLVFLEAAHPEDRPAWGRLSGVRNIAVGRHCRRLHFLQASEHKLGAEGEEIARWVIHCANGSVREWPVLYGQHVRDWWWYKDNPKEANHAVIAWESRPIIPVEHGAESVCLFKATWTNPQPDMEITHLDFVLGKTLLRPFVVAITAE